MTFGDFFGLATFRRTGFRPVLHDSRDQLVVETESKRMRTLAARYLIYSDKTSFVVAPFDHHGSIRSRSETTGYGIKATSGN